MTANRVTFAAVVFAVVAGAYAVARILTLGVPTSVPSVSPWLGWLLLVPAFVVGQVHRGWMHARGIRRSHFAAIVGAGVAVVSLAVFALIALGGAL